MRFSHGADGFYTALGLARPRALARAGRVLVEAGVVWFARREDGWEATASGAARARASRWSGSSRPTPRGFPEPGDRRPRLRAARAGGRGAAGGGRRARAGGAGARGGRALERGRGAAGRRRRVVVDGRPLEADHVVWACGAWLAGLFPEHVPPARHPPGGRPLRCPPEWASPPRRAGSTSTRASTGTGSIEPHGMKVASDREGDPVDPDARPRGAADAERRRRRATTSPPASRRWRARRCARRPAATTG